MSLLWINGTLTDKADAKVSPFDHGFLYGDGVWEHLRVFGGKLFRPAEHLDLLFAAADTLGIDIPLSRAELTAAIEATVKSNARTEGYVRVIVTRGPGTIGPDPRKLDPQVIIIAEEYRPFPDELYGHGLHADLNYRIDACSDLRRVRTLAQLDIARAKARALGRGCLEALIEEKEYGQVFGTEGVVFAARHGAVAFCSAGFRDVMSGVVGDLLKTAGIRCETGLGPKPGELAAVDELFLAGTACGVIGIVRVNGLDIGTGTEGPITKAVRERYHALTRGES